MCRPATCSQCGRATFAGCGAHVKEVLGGIPASRRCRCDSGRPLRAESPLVAWLKRVFSP